MMRSPLSLVTVLLFHSSMIVPTWAFHCPVVVHRHVVGSPTRSTRPTVCLAAKDNDDDDDDEPATTMSKVNLVNQARYVNSIETLQREMAKLHGIDYTPPSPDQTPVYVLGRFDAPLRIDSAPGLDLTETEYFNDSSAMMTTTTGTSSSISNDENNTRGGLVLVTSVTGNAAEAGLQALDTIVAVSCQTTNPPPFYANVNSCDLPTTAQALQAAMKHALDNNVKEIHLEMNRLITGYYGAE